MEEPPIKRKLSVLKPNSNNELKTSDIPAYKRSRHNSNNNSNNNDETLNDLIKEYEEMPVGEQTFKNYILTLKRSNLPEPIEGGSARVYIIKIGGKKYALKKVDLSKYAQALYNELSALKKLNKKACSCSPILAGATVFNQFIYILMSYTDGKTLDKWLSINPSPSTDQIEKRFEELKNGLKEIHEIGIIHGDIKPSNIWIPEDPEIPAYFIDFGSATKEGEHLTSYTPGVHSSPLASNTASKDYNIEILRDLKRSILKTSGGKYKSRSHKRKKLNKTRRHHKRHN